MKKRFISAVAMLLLIATVASVFAGCSDLLPDLGGLDLGGMDSDGSVITPTLDLGGDAPDADATQAQDAFALPGIDVFGGERFDEMIWGYYEADCYDYDGSHEAANEFLTDMEFITIPQNGQTYEFAALPLTMQAGKYSHFMGTFNYEGEYYEPYTENGKAMFRKAFIAEQGDMTEAQFQKIEDIMQLDVVSMTLALRTGATFTAMLAYELQNNSIALYDLTIDDDYNITISAEPLVEYYFLHDGGKLSLLYKNVQRDYLASGYKETDPSLSCSGYALNAQNKYEDLEGFSFFQFGADAEISVYVDLSDGEAPVDPVMTLDTQTGDFTLSWQERWVNTASGIDRVDDPRSISGKYIPCTNYGFTDYSGFFLIIDGTCYRYLMSEKEYEERMYSDILGDVSLEDVSESKLEELAVTKRNILEELKEALDAAGIAATIDTASGKVTLEANFLFATNSAEISAEGKDYLNRFIDVYTSVVLGDTYADYISNIVIEGHTDTSGSYALNQALSEERANAVASHCIAQSAALTDVIQTKGCAYDFPVYNDDGTVNMDKSRRVTFSFVFANI